MATETVPGVELFATGTYRGRAWTLRDLDEMAANARTLGPTGLKLLRPPAVLGHERADERNALKYYDRTDLPAAAWLNCESLRVRKYADPATGRVEGILVGDFEQVPPGVAALIRARRYRKVSAEIYDDFQDDHGKSYGKAIRRIALLGGEIPQVKRLADLPMPVARMAEHRSHTPSILRLIASAVTNAQTTVHLFAETDMDRQQMIAAVQAAMPNLSQAWCEAQTDDALAELVTSLPAPAAPAAAAANATVDLMADPATMTREELVTALVAAGVEEDSLDELTDDELRDMLTEQTADEATNGEGDRQEPDNAAAFAEAARGRAAKWNESLEARERRLAARERADKARDAEQFCDRLVREGRLLRSQVAVMALPALVNLDDTRAVHHFNDGGRAETLTAYELKKRELARLPFVIRFGEKFREGHPAGPEKARELAVEKARRHADTVSDQAWRQTSFRTKEGFVQKFSETFAKNPDVALRMLPENLRG